MAAMSGILMLVTKEMEVITVTDNIYTMLGINMVDILGRNLNDFIHPCDLAILQSVFTNEETQQQLCLRVKNLLQDNGRVVSMRQAAYKVGKHKQENCMQNIYSKCA
jgi:light-regulated signal transduction histidine kinase (bacteriophytochrome)